MKKYIALIVLILAVFSADAQIKKIEVDNNYLVLTDTVTNSVDWIYPASMIRYTVTGSNYVKFYGREDDRISNGQLSYHVDSLVNSLNAAFVDIAALETFLRTSTGFSSAGASASTTGWGAYSDAQYTELSSFSLTGGAAFVHLPNNAGNTLEIQLPLDITTFYDGTVITGREGDGINITISFAVRPLTAQPTRITTAPDIGGAVGIIEDYEHDEVFEKGQNVVQRYLKAYNAYTLDTWEANGATMKIKASENAEIFGVRYLITRTHKAR